MNRKREKGNEDLERNRRKNMHKQKKHEKHEKKLNERKMNV